jgi:SAM-dependent methyltransferase
MRDLFASGLFPLSIATHNVGLTRLFDLATVLTLLDCRPGDRVLDLGAGAGFSSEMLARFGYRVVAIDPDLTALAHTRRRPSFDASRIEGSVRVVCGLAEPLPFAQATFDGAIGLNVLHHVADLPATVRELARVLKPGTRGVFCEPGLQHLDMPETRRAIREFGEDDKPFDVVAFLSLARRRGFSEAMLSATLQPPLSLVRLEELDQFAAGEHPRAQLTPQGTLEELRQHHTFAVLVREGARPKTSRHPGVLRYELQVDGLVESARPGDRLSLSATITNVGDSLWFATPSDLGGHITLGCRLMSRSGRLVTDSAGRTPLPSDVAPGEKVVVPMTIPLPDTLYPGTYELQFDLVNELVCWLSDLPGNTPVTRTLHIV